MHHHARIVGVGIALLAVGVVILAALPQQPPQSPTFRSRITLVPVDVRVLDADGKPITGLKLEDFTLLEDGAPQEIRHFLEYALSPETPEPGAQPALRKAQSTELTPQKARIFLIVLGRGRLQEPSKGMDALLRFVRQQLLPQDQVAVLAYNRASDFTTDHEKVAQVLERFRRGHEMIEALIAHQFSGLQAVYGSKEISDSTQKKIDQMLRGPGTAPIRKLSPVRATDAARLADDTRKDTDTIQRAEIVGTHEIKSPFDDTAIRDAERFDMSFEQYASSASTRDQDLGNIYTGIEYMRYLEGEKHLVFVTAGGIVLPRLENDLSIAAMANDARVVLDTIQTGGIPGPPPPSGFAAGFALTADKSGPSGSQLFALQTLKSVSELTGGISSTTAYADRALNRINQATMAGYQLGYYPANPNWDGKYRRIAVQVNRAGVTVQFRHGYYGRDVVVPLDRRAFLTFNRVAAAAGDERETRDIPVRVKASLSGGVGQPPGEALVEVTIDLSRVRFVLEGDRRVASLDVDVFCGDDKENLVGESWEKANLHLKDDTYQRLLRDGFVHTTRIRLKGPARYVKAVVYDYAADLLGSAVIKVR